jgi:hypothetical protein
MRSARPLMRHPAMTQLLQDPGLAPDRHFAGPFSVYPEAKRAPGGEGQIDQLDFELLSGLKVANDHAIVRFGTGHAPFYVPKAINASKKSMSNVHAEMYSLVYRISSTSS